MSTDNGTGASPAAPPRLPPAYSLVALETVGSTNDEAKRLAAEGAEDGTVVWAREQTAGRGRHGRHWVSPPGNLYLSLILRPDCSPQEAPGLGLTAAVALGQALGAVVPPMTPLHYKWPNDVLVNELKVAGFLMESATRGGGRLDWLVLGLGVNVASAPAETLFPATSLRAAGCEIGVEELLELFCRHYLNWVNRWLDEGLAPVRRAWLAHGFRLGETIEVRLGKETLSGTFADLDEGGALVLETNGGGRRVVNFGDVFAANG